MKKLVALLSMVLLLSAAVPALAQWNPTIGHQEWVAFNGAHPGIENDLHRNPSLLFNPGYINSHPALKDWLANHPDERNYLYSEHRGGYAPSSWMNFMHENPSYQNYYYNNPSYFGNPGWVAQHPELNEYFRSHPGVERDLVDRAHHPDDKNWHFNHAWNDAHENVAKDENWGHSHH